MYSRQVGDVVCCIAILVVSVVAWFDEKIVIPQRQDAGLTPRRIVN